MFEGYMTVGQLRKLLSDNTIPDDAKIMVERVEDVYFESNGWKTLKSENYLLGYPEEYVPAFWCSERMGMLFINLHY